MLYWKDNKFHKEDYKAIILLEKEIPVLTNEDYKEKKEEPIYELTEIQYEEISWIHDKESFEEIQQRVFNRSKDDIKYEELIFNEEQMQRLEEINEYDNIDMYYIGYVIDYVVDGTMSPLAHNPLKSFYSQRKVK